MNQLSRNHKHFERTKRRLDCFAMSNEKEDERRLYQCVRKYGKIVKQFDELIELMNARAKPPKRRRVAPSSGGTSSATTPGPASSSQPDSNEVFVQTITRFLQELRADSTTDPDCSTRTPDQEQRPT